MGYTTDFGGHFTLNKPLSDAHAAYLLKFAHTRRMGRNEDLTAKRPDPVREAVGLPVGPDGAYFVGEGGLCGQGEEAPGGDLPRKRPEDILDYNREPASQPGLWCQWVPGQTNDVHECERCTKNRQKNDFEYKSLKDGPEGKFCPRCGWKAPKPVYDIVEWDGGEKFYNYVEWLEYLIKHFLARWGYVLNGEVTWQGEESDDRGIIYVKDNMVQAVEDHITSPKPVWPKGPKKEAKKPKK